MSPELIMDACWRVVMLALLFLVILQLERIASALEQKASAAEERGEQAANPATSLGDRGT